MEHFTNYLVRPAKKVYIVAEAGVNHNGDPKLALQLVEAAKSARADAIKFQTFKTEKLLTRSTRLAEYQKTNSLAQGTQYEMIKALELSCATFTKLKNYARSIDIDFLSTPDDEQSLNFLCDKLGLPIIKIGSGEVTNLPFLRKIAKKQKPIILSTGMSSLGDVERAIRTIRCINKNELMLLHCTTSYPCLPEEVNLRAMQTLKQAFNLRVGYSDHTIGSAVPVAAVALGAELIEKHLTLDRKLQGPDHHSSLEPHEFAEMVQQVRAVEKALGTGVKWPSPSEETVKPIIRRRIVAACYLKKGTKLKLSDLNFKRANEGIFVEHVYSLIGVKVRRSIRKDQPLLVTDLAAY